MADEQNFDPLGIASMVTPPPPQGGPAQQPQLPTHHKSGKGGIAVQAALAAIVPLIAKRGGPLAVAGLLRGFQQAQAESQHTADLQGQQTFENQRQVAGDQRAQDAQQATEQYRQQTLAGTLWHEATSAIQNAESPDAIGPLLDLYKQRMAQLGMRDTGALDRFAQQTVTPSRMEQKAAQKYIGQLEKTYGQDWAQKVGSATFVLPSAPADPATGKPRAITVQELLAKSGLNMDGLPVKPPTERTPIPGSFEDFTTSTDPAVRERILADRKLYGQSDDKPAGSGPRDRFNIQTFTNPDGTTGFVRVNLDTGKAERVDLPGGAGAGNATDTQRLSKAYLDRTTASDTTATAFEQRIARLGPQIDVQLPNLLKSEVGQRYKQAEDEFINAALRRESGAAIQPSEYERFEKIYFVRPGDTAATIAQKQTARTRVIDGFRVAAGNMGAQSAPPPPPLTKDAQIGQVYTYNGKRVKVREKTRTGFLFDEVP